MSKKIVITVVAGGNPMIEVNGEDVVIRGTQLSYLAEEINRVTGETSGLKNNLLGISACGGKITRRSKINPANKLEDVISFSDIVLHKMSGNTREAHLIKEVFPVLALLFWQRSEHFERPSTDRFECAVCGHPHLPVFKFGSPRSVPPDFCEILECSSHKILKMLGTE